MTEPAQETFQVATLEASPQLHGVPRGAGIWGRSWGRAPAGVGSGVTLLVRLVLRHLPGPMASRHMPGLGRPLPPSVPPQPEPFPEPETRAGQAAPRTLLRTAPSLLVSGAERRRHLTGAVSSAGGICPRVWWVQREHLPGLVSVRPPCVAIGRGRGHRSGAFASERVARQVSARPHHVCNGSVNPKPKSRGLGRSARVARCLGRIPLLRSLSHTEDRVLVPSPAPLSPPEAPATFCRPGVRLPEGCVSLCV